MTWTVLEDAGSPDTVRFTDLIHQFGLAREEMQPTHHLVDWLGAVITIIQDLRMEPPFLLGEEWNGISLCLIYTCSRSVVRAMRGGAGEQSGPNGHYGQIVWNDHLVEGTVTPSVKPSSSHPVVVKLCPDRDCHSNAIYASFSVFLVIQFHSVLNTAAWLIGRIPKFGHFYMYLQTGCFMLHLIVGMQAFHCHLSLAMDLCSAAQGLLVVPPSHAFAMQLHCGWMQPASFLPVLCIFFQWLQTILFECGHALSGQKGFSSRGAT